MASDWLSGLRLLLLLPLTLLRPALVPTTSLGGAADARPIRGHDFPLAYPSPALHPPSTPALVPTTSLGGAAVKLTGSSIAAPHLIYIISDFWTFLRMRMNEDIFDDTSLQPIRYRCSRSLVTDTTTTTTTQSQRFSAGFQFTWSRQLRNL